MASNPLVVNLTSQIVINETIGSASFVFASDGSIFNNYVNSSDASYGDALKKIFIPKLTGTVSIPLPAGATKGVFALWRFDQKVSLLFNFGTMSNSDIGMVRVDFTSLTITNTGQQDVNGHLIILGS